MLRRLKGWFDYVRTPAVFPDRWQDRLFRGHVNVGPVTIYGANAMHWAVNAWFRGAYWCFHPTTRTFGARWPWYFYISRDATPSSATFAIGPGVWRKADEQGWWGRLVPSPFRRPR